MKTIMEDDMNEIFQSYLNKVCEVDIGASKPVYGELVRVGKKFIAIKRRDGRIISISKDCIKRLQPTRTQFKPLHTGWLDAEVD